MPQGKKRCCGVKSRQKCKLSCEKHATFVDNVRSVKVEEDGTTILRGFAVTSGSESGFPHMTTVGMWWWKREVPLGWEIVGKSKYKPCQMCYNLLSVGIEKDESFLFCPVCFLKPE